MLKPWARPQYNAKMRKIWQKDYLICCGCSNVVSVIVRKGTCLFEVIGVEGDWIEPEGGHAGGGWMRLSCRPASLPPHAPRWRPVRSYTFLPSSLHAPLSPRTSPITIFLSIIASLSLGFFFVSSCGVACICFDTVFDTRPFEWERCHQQNL